MKQLIIISLLLFSGQLLMASEITVKKEVFKDKFCKDFKSKYEEGEFCLLIEKEYPIVTSKDKHLERYLTRSIKESVGIIKKGEAKKYVLDAIKEDYLSVTAQEERLFVKILSLTPKTYTLELSGYEYRGGAHGNSYTKLINYDRATGKEIKVDALFIEESKKELTRIIEKEYRKQERIGARESLFDKLDWFHNDFVLASNIGIGEDGLHLEYDPYEIKPYAGGPTSLVVPYKLLKNIIKPNGYLFSFIQPSKMDINDSRDYRFFDKLLTLEVEVTRIEADKLELRIVARSETYDVRKGGVSLSFPQLREKSEVIDKSVKGFNKILVYPKKSLIYNFRTQKGRKSDYLLVEGEAKNWKDNEKKEMQVMVKIPKDSKKFDINLRATLIKKRKILQIPFDGIKGQQGVANYYIHLSF